MKTRIEICIHIKKISFPKTTSYPLTYTLVKLSKIFFSKGINILWSETVQEEVTLVFSGLPAKGVPEVFSHLLIKLSSKKIHEDDRQKIWCIDLSLPAFGVPLLFWRRFVHSLLITLAKIDPGSLIISLNTTVRCTAMKFSRHRLLNKDRAVSVIRNCQAWPRATV